MASEYFPNNAVTTTTSDPGAGGTSVTVNALPTSVTPGNAGQFRAIIYDPANPDNTYEIVTVTNVAGANNLTWTISRAVEGPAAQAHASGQIIKAIVTNAGLLNLAPTQANMAAILSSATPAAVAYTGAAGSGTAAAKNDHAHAVSLTTTSATPSGNVAFTSATTWYDICSVSLAAGTWRVMAIVEVTSSAAPSVALWGKIYDATTPSPNSPVSQVNFNTATANGHYQLVLTALVTPAQTTSYALAGGSSNTGASAVKTSASFASATGPGTILIAVRVG